jgi:hypothetical protein
MGHIFEETNGNYCPFRVILNGDHGGFGVQRAVFVFAFDDDMIGKFQRTIKRKKGFVRRAEFDDGFLNEDAAVFGVAGVVISAGVVIVIASRTAEADRNPHRSGFGKEPGQAAYDVWFERVSSCLVVHRETSTPKLEQTNLPLFLVGKVCEEISSALSA